MLLVPTFCPVDFKVKAPKQDMEDSDSRPTSCWGDINPNLPHQRQFPNHQTTGQTGPQAAKRGKEHQETRRISKSVWWWLKEMETVLHCLQFKRHRTIRTPPIQTAFMGQQVFFTTISLKCLSNKADLDTPVTLLVIVFLHVREASWKAFPKNPNMKTWRHISLCLGRGRRKPCRLVIRIPADSAVRSLLKPILLWHLLLHLAYTEGWRGHTKDWWCISFQITLLTTAQSPSHLYCCNSSELDPAPSYWNKIYSSTITYWHHCV